MSDIQGEAGRWNFHPGEEVQNNPLFDWPPNPRAVARWYGAYWLVISTTSRCVSRSISSGSMLRWLGDMCWTTT